MATQQDWEEWILEKIGGEDKNIISLLKNQTESMIAKMEERAGIKLSEMGVLDQLLLLAAEQRFGHKNVLNYDAAFRVDETDVRAWDLAFGNDENEREKTYTISRSCGKRSSKAWNKG